MIIALEGLFHSIQHQSFKSTLRLHLVLLHEVRTIQRARQPHFGGGLRVLLAEVDQPVRGRGLEGVRVLGDEGGAQRETEELCAKEQRGH